MSKSSAKTLDTGNPFGDASSFGIGGVPGTSGQITTGEPRISTPDSHLQNLHHTKPTSGGQGR